MRCLKLANDYNFWLNSFLFVATDICMQEDMHKDMLYVVQNQLGAVLDWTPMCTQLEADFPSAELQIESESSQ